MKTPKIESRIQWAHTITIGFPEDCDRQDAIENFLDKLGSAINRTCGGLRADLQIGMWVECPKEPGSRRARGFPGKQTQEDAYVFHVTVEDEKNDEFVGMLRGHIAIWADYLCLDVDWVHHTVSKVLGIHFSAKDQIKSVSRADYRAVINGGF